MIDTCTRLTQAVILQSRTTAELHAKMTDMWFKPYGPPKLIETDQEGGMVNVESKKLLSQYTTHIKERGVGSHATMVERHHQVLRDSHAKAKDQANKEGSPFTEESLLAEVVIAKNILTNIAGYSPIQAVFCS